MPAELWREVIQYGKEVTAGTAVAASRKAYLRNVSLTKERDSRPHRFAVGTRDNVRAHTQGPVAAGGSVAFPMSADEMIEWLLITLAGGVTPTTPTGGTLSRLWTFTPSTTLDSMTIERNDGAMLQRGLGIRGNTLTIAGNVNGENLVTVGLFGTNREDPWAGPLTPALTDRTPTFMEGWQTNFYLDAFSATFGTTNLTDMLMSWDITFNNNLSRRYTAANTLSAHHINFGELDITATLVFDAAGATAATEIGNWAADTKRSARLEFLGPADDIEATFRRFVTIDLPGAWTTPDTNQEEGGARAYSLPLTYVYDPTLAAGVRVRAQNARTAAFA